MDDVLQHVIRLCAWCVRLIVKAAYSPYVLRLLVCCLWSFCLLSRIQLLVVNLLVAPSCPGGPICPLEVEGQGGMSSFNHALTVLLSLCRKEIFRITISFITDQKFQSMHTKVCCFLFYFIFFTYSVHLHSSICAESIEVFGWFVYSCLFPKELVTALGMKLYLIRVKRQHYTCLSVQPHQTLNKSLRNATFSLPVCFCLSHSGQYKMHFMVEETRK